jgi:hypothetical protein
MAARWPAAFDPSPMVPVPFTPRGRNRAARKQRGTAMAKDASIFTSTSPTKSLTRRARRGRLPPALASLRRQHHAPRQHLGSRFRAGFSAVSNSSAREHLDPCLARKACGRLELSHRPVAEQERSGELTPAPGCKNTLPGPDYLLHLQKIRPSQYNLRALLPKYGVLEPHDLICGLACQCRVKDG